ncbi:MAG: hypothetical protein AAGE93_04680, partial [Bacteroidota bacterium]
MALFGSAGHATFTKNRLMFLPQGLQEYFITTAEIWQFARRFFQQVFRPPYEFEELLRQAYRIGYQSLPLVG